MSSNASVIPEQPVHSEQRTPSEQIIQVGTGFMASMSLFIASKLRIADHLAHGPKTIRELAAATKVNQDRLYRVLRSLAMTGIFSELADRKFELTPAASTLRTDIPESTHAMVEWICDPFHFKIFS